jgi:hypothetical protein
MKDRSKNLQIVLEHRPMDYESQKAVFFPFPPRASLDLTF